MDTNCNADTTLTKTVARVRHKHVGGGVHLVRGSEEGLDDDILNGSHEGARVDALALQVPQKGTQRPLVSLVIHLWIFISDKDQDTTHMNILSWTPAYFSLQKKFPFKAVIGS